VLNYSITRDGRHAYLIRNTAEADIWLATLSGPKENPAAP